MGVLIMGGVVLSRLIATGYVSSGHSKTGSDRAKLDTWYILERAIGFLPQLAFTDRRHVAVFRALIMRRTPRQDAGGFAPRREPLDSCRSENLRCAGSAGPTARNRLRPSPVTSRGNGGATRRGSLACYVRSPAPAFSQRGGTSMSAMVVSRNASSNDA